MICGTLVVNRKNKLENWRDRNKSSNLKSATKVWDYLVTKSVKAHPLIHVYDFVITLSLHLVRKQFQIYFPYLFFFSKSGCWFMTLAITRSTYIHDCRIPQTQSLTFKYSTNESTWAWYWDPKIICNNWHMLSISMLFCFSSDKNKLHKVDISMCVRMIKRKDTVMFQDETTSQTC